MSQIVSRSRVRDFGEVYTMPREVNAMLDLVQSECLSIYSTFLEPSCGNGAFLIEILRRKLSVCSSDFEGKALISLSTIYGVDILLDNVISSRNRLYSEMEAQYFSVVGLFSDNSFLEKCRYILSKNIVQGDFLKDDIEYKEWCRLWVQNNLFSQLEI